MSGPGVVEKLFPIADQVRCAASAAERAALLLRLSDEVILSGGPDLLAACRDCLFAVGEMYLMVRMAALCATRDASGELPEKLAAQLDRYRNMMVYAVGHAS